MGWPKGKKHTKLQKLKIARAQRKFYSNPAARLRMSRIKKKQYKENPDLIKKIDKVITGWWKEHPSVRKKRSDEMKKLFSSHPKAFAEFLKHGKNPLKKHLKTKSGCLVRSNGERTIADFLFDNKIKFGYEEISLFFKTGRYSGNICTPDFFLPSLNIFIEFYGGYPGSWKKKVLKNKIYSLYKIPVLGITPAELKDLDYYLLKDAERLANTKIAKKFDVKKWK